MTLILLGILYFLLLTLSEIKKTNQILYNKNNENFYLYYVTSIV